MKRRSRAATKPTPTIDEKLELFTRCVKFAQELETAGSAVILCARWIGEVAIEHWPAPLKTTDMATYLLGDMINLVTEDGKEDWEYSSVPPRGSLNTFTFYVDGKRLSIDEVATLLASKAPQTSPSVPEQHII